jgi:hypothetical protein
MTPDRLLHLGIIPAMIELEAFGIKDTVPARRFMLAIALQESGLMHRRQIGRDYLETGPAASFWQFEAGGGCKGVLTHHKSAEIMRRVCDDFNVACTPGGLWEAMRYNDIVAAAAARMLIYTLPHSLPTTASEGWLQYLVSWRPGMPRQTSWSANWDLATLVTGA